jgi:hypothetical protein
MFNFRILPRSASALWRNHMIELSKVGGVQIFGHIPYSWLNEKGRRIKGCPVEFDSDVYSPDVDTGVFLLPAHRGQLNYQIHLLENGCALVIKEGRLYLCTKVNDELRVITFTTVPSDQQITELL